MQEPSQKPRQIPEADFARFEIVTQGNINGILEDIENGKRDDLNGVYLGYNDYLTLAGWMENIEAYIREAEAYFAEADNRYLTFKEKQDDGER